MWHSTHDSRVRRSHAHMDGVICAWSNPPSPEALIGEKSVGTYNPGGIWNCRCFAEPINPDIIREQLGPGPFKVFRGGTDFQRMTIAQVERMILNGA